jgi:hypothetical protein
MRTRSLLAAALVAAAVGTTAPAHAGPPSDAQYIGIGCFLVAINDTSQLLTPPDVFNGLAVGAAVGYAPTLAHNPVSPTITCDVEVEGVPASGTAPLVTGPVLGFTAGPVTFTAPDAEFSTVSVCTNVSTTDNHGQTIVWPRTCDPVDRFTTLPAQEVLDLLSPLCVLPGGPVVCAFLDALKVHVIDNLP